MGSLPHCVKHVLKIKLNILVALRFALRFNFYRYKIYFGGRNLTILNEHINLDFKVSFVNYYLNSILCRQLTEKNNKSSFLKLSMIGGQEHSDKLIL